MVLHKACLAGLITLVSLAACAHRPTAPNRSFTQDGTEHHWQLFLGGPSISALYLFRNDPDGIGRPVVALFCHGDDQGSLQVRDGAADGRFVTLAANDRIFTVRGNLRDAGESISVQGRAAIPHDWLRTLGEAETVTVAYGEVQRDFIGPGEDVVRRYQQDCRRLG